MARVRYNPRSTRNARDNNSIATSYVRRFSVPFSAPTLSDRRVFDFSRDIRPAYVSYGPRSASRVVAVPRGVQWGVPGGLAFADPRRVDLCKRREDRRRVLHARGAAGGRVRRPRRGPWSDVRC